MASDMEDREAQVRRKTIAVGVGIVIAATLAGCSAKSATQATTTTSSSPSAVAPGVSTTAAPSIQSLMLSITDLPTGWSVDNTAQSVSTSCYDDPLKHVASTSYANVDFAQGGSLPELVQELGLYASGPSAFATITHTLNGCKTFSETSKGQSVSGVMGPMSSPSYGDQSAAYDATLTTQGESLNQGFVMVRKGNYLTIIALGDLGSLDAPTLQGFVNQAVAKIPG